MPCHDSDFIQVQDESHKVLTRFMCAPRGIDWPPPLFLTLHGRTFKRLAHSAITAEDIKTMPHVARGALYEPEAVMVLPLVERVQ
jgi:hypothetical protein